HGPGRHRRRLPARHLPSRQRPHPAPRQPLHDPDELPTRRRRVGTTLRLGRPRLLAGLEAFRRGGHAPPARARRVPPARPSLLDADDAGRGGAALPAPRPDALEGLAAQPDSRPPEEDGDEDIQPRRPAARAAATWASWSRWLVAKAWRPSWPAST